MFTSLILLLPISFSLLSAVSADPISSRAGLSIPITADVPGPSQTLEPPEANFDVHCVPPTKHRMWEGEINATDCKAALFAIDLEVSRFGTRDFTFWSEQYEPFPPLDPWKLPYAKSSGRSPVLKSISSFPTPSLPLTTKGEPFPGSCYVLFRIAKDFGDNVLPISDREYLVTSTRLTTFRSRWISLILTLRALVECIEVQGQPGWSSVSDDKGILLLFPVSSGMHRIWAATNGIVDGINGTSLELVNVS